MNCGHIPLVVAHSSAKAITDSQTPAKNIAYVGTINIQNEWEGVFAEPRVVIPEDFKSGIINGIHETFLKEIPNNKDFQYKTIDSEQVEKVNSSLTHLYNVALTQTTMEDIRYPDLSNWGEKAIYDVHKLDQNKLFVNYIAPICSSLDVDAILIGFNSYICVLAGENPFYYSDRTTFQIINKSGIIEKEWTIFALEPQPYYTQKPWDPGMSLETAKTINQQLMQQASAIKMMQVMSDEKPDNFKFISPMVKIEKDNSISIVVPDTYLKDYTLTVYSKDINKSFPMENQTELKMYFGNQSTKATYFVFPDAAWTNIGKIESYTNDNGRVIFQFSYSNDEMNSMIYNVDQLVIK